MTAQATRAATYQAPPTAAAACAGDLAQLQVGGAALVPAVHVGGALAPAVRLRPEQQMRQDDCQVTDHLLRSSPVAAAAGTGAEVVPDYLP